MISTSVINHH